MTEQNPEEGQQTGSGLRAQLEAALAENAELKQQVEQGFTAQRDLAFIRAGIDTESGPGKLLAKSYDGELDPEAITQFAEEYGIELGKAGRTQADPAVETQQRADTLRAQSQPDGTGQRLSMQEFLKLNSTDTAAARQAFEAGQVDVPPHVAQQLAANGRGN